ncbi:unnamed protein product [Caenorhabditis auriculariae]|uniref:K Homology domain-containing protein n=1 Tax=Caenorhabditis auriculariae TaxID=2777116 RepID=A0A8S1HPY1_9PELO|nr:unnamed protein product [Caenorhabditis auriculariae]
MTDNNHASVDVMSLDKNSELAARLCAVQNGVNMALKTGYRAKSTSPSSAANNANSSSLYHFAHLLPVEIFRMNHHEQEEVFRCLYDHGVKAYMHLQSYAFAQTKSASVAAGLLPGIVANSTVSSATSTIAKIASHLGFSSPSPTPSANLPSVEVITQCLAWSNGSEVDEENLEGALAELRENPIVQVNLLSNHQVPVEHAADALTVLVNAAMRRPLTRCVESVMAASQVEAGDSVDQDGDRQLDYANAAPNQVALKPAEDEDGLEEEPESQTEDEDEEYDDEEGVEEEEEEEEDEADAISENTIRENGLLELACTVGFEEMASMIVRVRGTTEFTKDFEVSPLMESAAAGTIGVLRRLIKLGADVSSLSRTRNTALIYAAAAGQPECVKELLDTGNCSIEHFNLNGHCALMEAASSGRLDIVKMLVEAGAPSNYINLNSEFKESALTLASYKGNIDIVRYLLETYEASQNVQVKEYDRGEELHTSVMEACMDGHMEVVQLLLDHGAPVNLNTDSFESPLTLACCGGHHELAKLLLDNGAYLEATNDENYTPLMEASREGHLNVVEVLLAHGANVNAQTEETGETALSVAACGGFIDIMKALIEKGGDLTAGSNPPLVEAAQEGHLSTVEFILQQGDIPKDQIRHAFVLAADCGQREVLRVLLDAGADVACEVEGRTALMRAAKNDYVDVVSDLITYGAPVNYRSSGLDATALSLACAEGNTEVVRVLLKNGADPHIENKDKTTCLFESARNGNTDVMKILIEYGRAGALPRPAASQQSGNSSGDTTTRTVIPKTSKGPLRSVFKKGTVPRKASVTSTTSIFSGSTTFQYSTTELELLAQMEKLQRDIAANEQSGFPFSEAVKGMNAVYGVLADGKTNFPTPPSLCDLEKAYDGEDVASVADWAELVRNGWFSMQKQLANSQSEDPEHTASAYQAKLAEELRVPVSAVTAQLPIASEDALKLFNQHLTSHMNEGKVPCGHADSAIRAAFTKMTNAVRSGRSSVRASSVSSSNISNIDRECLYETVKRILPSFPNSELYAQANIPPIVEAHFSMNAIYPGIAAMAQKAAAKCAKNNTPLNKELAILAAYAATQLPDTPNNGGDIKIGERLLEDLLNGTTQAERKDIMDKMRKMLTCDLSNSPDKKLHEMYMELFHEHSKDCHAYNLDAVIRRRVGSEVYDPFMVSLPDPKAAGLMGISKHGTKKISKTVKRTEQTKILAHAPTAVSTLRRTHSEGDGSDRCMKTRNVAIDKATESNQETPLSIACANGHRDPVEILLKEGANIEHRDKKGFTPLIVAATAGHAPVVEVLLKNHAAIESQSDRTKDTALSLACSSGRKDVVELLLSYGANKEHRNVSDYTPLSLAASGGYIEIVNLLLNSGAEINSRTGSKLGISPLMLAAMNGHKEATRVLLERGSDINAQIETNRNTALTLACFQGRTEVVRLLLSYNANVEHRAKTGLTPLMEAANGGYTEVGDLLLEAGADPNTAPVPSSRDTALTIAADKGHEKFVELLVHRGAAIDARNKKGCTALWLACHSGHLETVATLVKHRGDPDALDNRKISPLMAAFKKGHVKVVKFMVEHAKQFPSDQELTRGIASSETEDVKTKCNECMTIIRDAKNAQAEEANKAAALLLAQLEEEEEAARSKKQAKQQKKEKKKAKKGKAATSSVPEDSVDEVKVEEKKEEEVPPTIEEKVVDENVEPVAEEVEEEKVEEPSRPETPPLIEKKEVEAEKNLVRKERKSRREATKGLNGVQLQPTVVQQTRAVSSPIAIPPTSPQPKPATPSDEWVKASGKKGKVTAKKQLAKEPITTSDEIKGWQDIELARKKQATLVVGSATIARVIGRGGSNINAIREATGASIEVEKQGTKKDPQAERQICIRGSPDAVRNATQMINRLITDGEVLVEDVIIQVTRANSSVASSVSSESSCRIGRDLDPLPPSFPIITSKPTPVAPTPSATPSTTNVWQQRMAARQQQLAANTDENSATSQGDLTEPTHLPSANMAHLMEKLPFAQETTSAYPEPFQPLSQRTSAPLEKAVRAQSQPISAPSQPPAMNLTSEFSLLGLGKPSLPDPVVPERLPNPIGPPPSAARQSEPRKVDVEPPASHSIFSKAPGSRPFGLFEDKSTLVQKEPVVSSSFRTLLPNISTDTGLNFSSIHSDRNLTGSDRPDFGNLEESIFEATTHAKLAEIWGNTDEKTGESTWGNPIFSSLAPSTLGSTDGSNSKASDWTSNDLLSYMRTSSPPLSSTSNAAPGSAWATPASPQHKNSSSIFSRISTPSYAPSSSQRQHAPTNSAPAPASSSFSQNNTLFNQLAAQLATYQGTNPSPSTAPQPNNHSMFFQPSAFSDASSLGISNPQSAQLQQQQQQQQRQHALKNFMTSYQAASNEFDSLTNILNSSPYGNPSQQMHGGGSNTNDSFMKPSSITNQQGRPLVGRGNVISGGGVQQQQYVSGPPPGFAGIAPSHPPSGSAHRPSAPFFHQSQAASNPSPANPGVPPFNSFTAQNQTWGTGNTNSVPNAVKQNPSQHISWGGAAWN